MLSASPPVVKVFPNPFNPSAVISFESERRSHVIVEVYDLAGRKVATLVDELQPAGPVIVNWDGEDVYGDRVASGVYFYRVSLDSQAYMGKMTLLK